MKKLPQTLPIHTFLPILFILVSILPLLGVLLITFIFHIGTFTLEVVAIPIILSIISAAILFTAFIYTVNLFRKESTLLHQELEEMNKGNYQHMLADSPSEDFEEVNKTVASMEGLLRKQHDEQGKKDNDLLQENQQLTNERDRLSSILSGIAHGVVAVDTNKNILFFNQAVEQMIGVPLTKAVGKPLDEIIHFYDKKERIAANFYIGQSESIAQKFREIGLDIETSQGRLLLVSLSTHFISFKDGSAGWIISFHDMSKQLESDVMKIDFVSMAAHELRTPLTSVRGYASLLKMEKMDQLDENGKQLLDRLMISSEILANFIENLLNVTRIEQNRFILALKPVDMTQHIKDTVANLSQLAKTKNQKLELHINGPLPIVMADSFRINQVLTNLIANAMHYTFDGGDITVTAENKDGFLQVSVSDTGQGIPADALPKLFTKFFRVTGVLEQGAKGTGLGLFISKSIIEMHHGKIWVTSEQGKGSTFSFMLPQADKELLKHKEN